MNTVPMLLTSPLPSFHCYLTGEIIDDIDQICVMMETYKKVVISKKGFATLPRLFQNGNLLFRLITAIDEQRVFYFKPEYLNNNMFWILSGNLLTCNSRYPRVGCSPYSGTLPNGIQTLKQATDYANSLYPTTNTLIFRNGKIEATGTRGISWEFPNENTLLAD